MNLIQRAIVFSLPAFLLLSAGCGIDRVSLQKKSDFQRTEAAVKIEKGELFAADQLLLEVVEADSLLQDAHHLAADRLFLAQTQITLGKYSSAAEHAMSAWQFYRQIGDHSREIWSMHLLARTHLLSGDADRCLALGNDALTLSRVYTETRLEAATLELLACAHANHAEQSKAYSELQSAAALYDKLNDPSATARTLSASGSLAATLGKQEDMRKAFGRTSLLLPGLADVLIVARIRLEYGLALLGFGQNMLAVSEVRQGLSLLDESPASRAGAKLQIRLYAALGEIFAAEFAYASAAHAFMEAYSIARSKNENGAIGYLLMTIAACELKKSYPSPTPDSYRAVREYYRQAAGFFARVGDQHGEAAASGAYGSVCDVSGSPDSALTAYRHSYDLMNNSAIDMNPSDDDLLDCASLPFRKSLTGLSSGFWFEQLAAAIARTGDAAGAYDILAAGRARQLSNRLREFSFEFRQLQLQKLYTINQERQKILRSMESELVVQRRQEMRNRDLFKIGELQKQFQTERESARAAAEEAAVASPAVSILFAGTNARASRYAFDLRPGTVLCDYLLTPHSVLVFLLSKDIKGPSIRTYEVRAPRDRVEELLHRLKTQRGEQATVLRELYDQFIKPVQLSLRERVIIIPPPEMDGIPFHAFLVGKDRTLLDLMDVSYLPHISFLPQASIPRKFLSSVLAFGFSTQNPWPLEYELRDVRSFYKEASTFTGQAATEQQLFGAIGDLLQCSFDFHTDPQVPSRSSFAVSSGSITSAGAEIPVERLTMLYPFSVVYLCDQQFGTTGLTSWHAAILMMNGTSTVIANLFPSEQKTNKVFSEKFYSTISNGESSNDAYRSAVLTLKGTTNAAVPSSWGMFFKFGR